MQCSRAKIDFIVVEVVLEGNYLVMNLFPKVMIEDPKRLNLFQNCIKIFVENIFTVKEDYIAPSYTILGIRVFICVFDCQFDIRILCDTKVRPVKRLCAFEVNLTCFKVKTQTIYMLCDHIK